MTDTKHTTIETAEYKEAKEFWETVWENTKFDSLPEEVKSELSDYSKMLDTWGHVAYELSGGRLSKQNYTADVYISVFEENLQEVVEEEVKESTLALLQEVSEQVIKNDDTFDTLDDTEKIYSASDMELIAVHMRNKLRAEQRKALESLIKKYK